MDTSHIGRRVVVRHRAGERGGRPLFSDLLGELLRFDDLVVVRTAAGEEVTVPASDIVAGKPVPPRPARRPARTAPDPDGTAGESGVADGTAGDGVVGDDPAGEAAVGDDPAGEAAVGDDPAGDHSRTIGVLELERIAALGWRGLESFQLGGWELRAAGGFTGRANSVLPLGDPPMPFDAALARVVDWYAERGLPPTFQLPLPTREDLRAALAERGWTDRWGAVVMTASIPDVLDIVPARPDLPPVTIADTPDAAWLAGYHYRGGELPPVGVQVLQTGAAPAFAAVTEAGTTVAIARAALDEGWVGLAAVEVDAAHRRRGLARHLLVEILRYAAARGARWAYLQTEETNRAAVTLYERAGFAAHHVYRYYRPADA
ncbi:MAG TPA: GNAT family N-acetyltransferase [Cryptosporangiaceae bacterium]|nr:GNAT family N-acetyltransferase [Cryptosporangiaceae bacterium]